MTTLHYDEKAAPDVVPQKSLANSASDAESLRGSVVSGPHDEKLVRQLKNRHIAMISIGGVIGTGLFLGTASSLRNGGPIGASTTAELKRQKSLIVNIGLLLGYMAVGSICYSVMISLGEMIAYLPIPGGHIKLAERFVDPAFSFTMGWNYWYNWTIILPAELSAAAVLIGYWNKEINPSAWISICLVVTVVINMCGAGLLAPNVKVTSIGGWYQSQCCSSITHSVLLGTIIIGLLVPSNAEGLDLASGDAASSPFVIAIQNAGIKALPSLGQQLPVTYTRAPVRSVGSPSHFRLYLLTINNPFRRSGYGRQCPKIFLSTFV
ncbi:Lysine-specific permease [Salix suchowensis]|nr:Lysine-specific permease [Salix suchowensis]